MFLRRFTRLPDGRKLKHYYTDESVGIATGFLIAAVHAAGLVSLTHTPSPMGFLTGILGRPKDIERPFLLLVVGYPGDDARVPDITRKPLAEIATFRRIDRGEFAPPWRRSQSPVGSRLRLLPGKRGRQRLQCTDEYHGVGKIDE